MGVQEVEIKTCRKLLDLLDTICIFTIPSWVLE